MFNLILCDRVLQDSVSCRVHMQLCRTTNLVALEMHSFHHLCSHVAVPPTAAQRLLVAMVCDAYESVQHTLAHDCISKLHMLLSLYCISIMLQPKLIGVHTAP